ncbi:PFS2 [Enterospora canceri]|uniref:Polyadenylation factor subunit 2 n=1 Tax=Enterospora canceri TaxID=1081671 RepID=A0A1Y1S7V1_9MICR|nr:PFS2 [Enterospora canceri]
MQNKQGGKFVYDGKRIQPIYERYAVDFNMPYIYSRFNGTADPFPIDSNLDVTSQLIQMRPASEMHPRESACTRYVQYCINKIRSPVCSLCWFPDGKKVLTGLQSGEITMWNGVTFNFDTILQAHSQAIKSMKWSRNNRLLLTGDASGVVKYWNTAMNNLNEVEVHQSPIKDISFSHDDSKFCTACDDATIKIVDVFESEVERTLRGHNWDVRKAQFHESMALIASGGKDNLLKLWDPRESACLSTFHYHKNTILSMSFFKENYLLSGGKDQVVKMLDLRMMKECFTYKDTGDVTALNVSSNLIFSGNGLGEINYWEEFNDEIIATSERRHDNTVWFVEMHPSGHCLVSGAADYTIRFWIRPRQQNKEEEKETQKEEGGTAIPGLLL